MNKAILQEKIHQFLDSRNSEELKLLVEGLHPSVTADALDGFTTMDVAFVLGLLPPRKRAELYSFLNDETKHTLLAEMDEKAAVEIVTYLSHDERVDLLAQVSEERRDPLIKKLAQKEREDVRRLESYEEGTIGAIMTSDYVALSAEMTASEALDKIRREAPDAETIYYAYVLDADRHLAGVVSLKHLILAKRETRIEDIMRRVVISLHPGAGRGGGARAAEG